jgi:hypothetical protein
MVAFDTDTSVTNVGRTIANLGTVSGNGTVFASVNNRTNSFLIPAARFGTRRSRHRHHGQHSTFVVELGLLPGPKRPTNYCE